MTTFKDLQHGTVNPFQPNSKAISYAIDKTLEQGVHRIDLITNGTHTLGLWLDNTYVGMFCGNSLTFELANDVYVEDVIVKEYNESGSIESAFIGIRHTAPAGTYPAQSIETSSLLNPISKILMYYADEKAFESGDDTGSTLEIDSPWGTQESTNYVHKVLNGYEYIPIKVSGAYIDPAIELGDIVSIDGHDVLVANVRWLFDGITTAEIEVPINNEINYDDPYNTLVNNQFKRKVSLGDAYQGVTISRDKGIEMLVSPDGTEENAIGRYYADIYRGIAFQTRDNKNQDWHDWLYFDIDKKTFRMSLVEEIKEEIKEIELTPGPQGPQGIPGKDGLDGKTYYTWVRYADDENGNGISNSPVGKTYIGLAFNKETETESNNPKDYKWSLLPQHLTVGGRNYWAISKEPWYSYLNYEGNYTFSNNATSSSFAIFRMDKLNVELNTKYTVSFEVMAKTDTVQFSYDVYYVNSTKSVKHNKPTLVKDKWVKVFATFDYEIENTDITHIYFTGLKNKGDFLIRNFKLEKGDIPTDWTPAPEDWENELLGVKEEVTINSTNLEMLPDSIMSQVMETYTSKSEMLEFEQQVSTQFTQTATDYEFLFSQVTEYIQTLDEETQAEFEEFRKYIRFVNGEIHLGNNQEPLELRIKNDRIAFLQNGNEVAFFSNNKFYVTDGHFINSLRIGNFEFRPRDNGSLSFGKVGE